MVASEPALGHEFGEWVTVKEATTTEEGQQKRTCSVCGKTETKSIPKITSTCTHTWQKYVKPSTTPSSLPFTLTTDDDYLQYNQTPAEWTIYYCTKCGQCDWTKHEYGKNQAEAATEFFSYLNALRNSLEEPNVYRSDYLDGIAQQRAVELISNYSHVGQRTSGENIDKGAQNIYEVFTDWYNSPGHYKIMTHKGNTYMGFGYAVDPRFYFLYACLACSD